MRVTGAFVCALSLCACSEQDAAQNQQGAARSVEAPLSPNTPQALQLTVLVKPIANGAHFEGRTNLPDGTELMLSIARPPVVGGDKATVAEGRFGMDILPKGGQPIPNGSYEVEVSTPLGDLQPADVKAQLGSEYEALTGPLLVKSSVSGARIVDYTTKVHIGGAVDPKADETARKAAYREHQAFADRSCKSNPDNVERLTGTQMSPEARARSIKSCLTMMERSREEMVREGLIQR